MCSGRSGGLGPSHFQKPFDRMSAPAPAPVPIRRVIMPSAPPSPPLILAKSRARRFACDPQGTPTARLAELARELLMEGGWWTAREMAHCIRQRGFNIGLGETDSSYLRLCDALAVMERMDLVRCMKMRRRDDTSGTERTARHFMWVGGSSTPGQPCTPSDLAEAATDARRRALVAENIIASIFMGAASTASSSSSTVSGGEEDSVAAKRARKEEPAVATEPGHQFQLPTLRNTMSDDEFFALLGTEVLVGTE